MGFIQLFDRDNNPFFLNIYHISTLSFQTTDEGPNIPHILVQGSMWIALSDESFVTLQKVIAKEMRDAL